jgi:hypothetical protein
MVAAYTETACARAGAVREKFEEMTAHLESRRAMEMTHLELEAYVIAQGRELQRLMVQQHLDLRTAAERRVRVVDEDGLVRREVRSGTRRLLTLVGPVETTRLLYQAEGKQARGPQDAALNLPAEVYSLGVRRRVAEEVASASFDHAVERLAATTGAPVPKRQAEQLAVRAATDFEAFYATRPVDPMAEKDLLLVLSFDGAGIVVRTQDLRPATQRAAAKQTADPRWPPRRLSKGQKRNHKRMAEVAAVYGVAPHVREPADILRDLRPVADAERRAARPKPVHKRVWASVKRPAGEVIRTAFDDAQRRDPDHSRRWVVLVDGNQQQIADAFSEATRLGVHVTVLVDLIHVLEYLWRAAYCFHPDGTPEAEQWVTARLRMLLEGVDSSDVAAGMRRSATRQGLESRAAVDECAGYLCKYRVHLRYAKAIRDGLPIATGVIEGACRYLVRDRMDKTGARWSLDGAEAVLQLRALRANGDFDAYWTHHVDAVAERVHRSRYAHSRVPNPLPATKHLRRVK